MSNDEDNWYYDIRGEKEGDQIWYYGIKAKEWLSNTITIIFDIMSHSGQFVQHLESCS